MEIWHISSRNTGATEARIFIVMSNGSSILVYNDQVWKGLSNLDPDDPGGFYKKPPLSDKGLFDKRTKWLMAELVKDQMLEDEMAENKVAINRVAR